MTGRSLTSNTYQASRPRCATLSTDRHNSPQTRLGWEPRTSLDEMIAEMVESDPSNELQIDT